MTKHIGKVSKVHLYDPAIEQTLCRVESRAKDSTAIISHVELSKVTCGMCRTLYEKQRILPASPERKAAERAFVADGFRIEDWTVIRGQRRLLDLRGYVLKARQTSRADKGVEWSLIHKSEGVLLATGWYRSSDVDLARLLAAEVLAG